MKIYASTWDALSEIARHGYRTTVINEFPYAAWRIRFGSTRSLDQIGSVRMI